MIGLCLTSLSFVALALPGHDVIPRTEAETASGRKLTLPDALVGQTSVLVVGFSKSSGKATEWWEAHLARDLAGPRKLSILRVAQLEALPGLLRGLLLGRIKNNVAKDKRDSFLMLFHEEGAWKKFVGFDAAAAPDDAYLVLVDSTGGPLWRGHAGQDEAAYASIKGRLDACLSPK